MSKKTIAVIFGGKSAEHEVSLVSATSVIKNLVAANFAVLLIGVSKEGNWLQGKDVIEAMKKGQNLKNYSSPQLIPSFTKNDLDNIDVFFPMIHGTYGEDGALQGFLEMTGKPYVGAGILGSATAMDKIVMKIIIEKEGLPVSKWDYFTKNEWQKDKNSIVMRIENSLSYPLFIKPANLGSSIGINKAKNVSELEVGINEATSFDTRILVEEAVANAREIEFAVLGNEELEITPPGEIVSSNEFYDYDAKYVDDKSEEKIPAEFKDKEIISKMQTVAKKAFTLLDCYGMGRVDFLVNRETEEFYINEINTIPGFTSISMYPKLWQAAGLNYQDLLQKLIFLAEAKFKTRNSLNTSYQPKKDWYSK
ncbi:MAG: D-alanine--D-alanine ligase family protein [bacterium]